MNSSKQIDVSICIVNWNAKNLLARCLESIKDKTTALAYEIIIVDNNSQDGSVRMVKLEHPECLLIESKKNLGFAKGNNRALEQASGKYILYLNPDTELISNAIYGMFDFLEKNTDFGAVGCKLVDSDGHIQFTCARAFPSPLNQFTLLTMLNKLLPTSRTFSTVEMNYWDHMDSREIDCLSGACIMARKDIIDSINGFDESYFMYAEDVDLCYRIKKQSWRIYYLSEYSIFHHEGGSSKQRSNRHFASVMQRTSNYYFINKHFGRIKAYEFRASVCVGSFIRLLALAILVPVYIIYKPGKISTGVFGKYSNLFLWSIGLREVQG